MRAWGLVVVGLTFSGCPGVDGLKPTRGELSVSPAAISFGTVGAGSTSSLQLTLENAGSAPVVITELSLGDDTRAAFSLAGPSLPATIPSGGTIDLTVRYHPLTEGADGALITILSDAANAPRLTVSLAGRALSTGADAGNDAGTTSDAAVDAGTDAGIDGGMSNGLDGGCALDEQWLFFDSDRVPGNRDLYAMKPGCPAHRLTREAGTDKQPAVSPDGTHVAFVSDRAGFAFQLFVMSLEDGGIVQVTTTPGVDAPAWSPDGQELAFRRGASVIRIPAAGGTEVPVVTGPDVTNAYKNPVYSADGLRLIVDRGNELSSFLLNGTDQRFIVGNTTTTIVEPALSPDGFNVAVAIWCFGGTSVWVVPFAGTHSACVGSGGIEVAGAVTRHPTWGESHLVWERGQPGELELGLPTAASASVNVTNDPADDRNPSFAPINTVLPWSM